MTKVRTNQNHSCPISLSLVVAPPAWMTQVPIKDLERSFMFNTGFQSSSAIAKNMEFAVGALDANRDFLKELQNEVDGKVFVVCFLWLLSLLFLLFWYYSVAFV